MVLISLGGPKVYTQCQKHSRRFVFFSLTDALGAVSMHCTDTGHWSVKENGSIERRLFDMCNYNI